MDPKRKWGYHREHYQCSSQTPHSTFVYLCATPGALPDPGELPLSPPRAACGRASLVRQGDAQLSGHQAGQAGRCAVQPPPGQVQVGASLKASPLVP